MKKDAEAVRFRFEGHAWTKRVMCGILAWIARCIADLHGSGALFLILENEKTSETVCFQQPSFIRAISFQKKQIYVLLTPILQLRVYITEIRPDHLSLGGI